MSLGTYVASPGALVSQEDVQLLLPLHVGLLEVMRVLLQVREPCQHMWVGRGEHERAVEWEAVALVERSFASWLHMQRKTCARCVVCRSALLGPTTLRIEQQT